MPVDSQTQKAPSSDLKSLDRLVGTWRLSGDMDGTSTFEWADEGSFLLHRFEFTQAGRRSKGLEIIGHEQRFGPDPSPRIETRIYGFQDGITYDYEIEAHDDGLTIWLGEKGSDIRFDATFESDDAYRGEWTSPKGGYAVRFARVR